MPSDRPIALIIPARNEAESLPQVLRDIPTLIDRVIVVDNGSSDGSGEVARSLGAEVIREERPGYGQACLAGLAHLQSNPPSFVAFADADGSDNHARLSDLLAPLLEDRCDFSLANRQPTTPQALTPQQRFGNWLATRLIRLLWGYNFHDLGPMRALRWESLTALHMQDEDFGWTVEMQIKALQHNLRICEVPIPYRPRMAGQSKISRTVSGVVRAGSKILWVVGREAWRQSRIAGAIPKANYKNHPKGNEWRQPDDAAP